MVENGFQGSDLDSANRCLISLSVHSPRYCGESAAKKLEVAEVLQLISQQLVMKRRRRNPQVVVFE